MKGGWDGIVGELVRRVRNKRMWCVALVNIFAFLYSRKPILPLRP